MWKLIAPLSSLLVSLTLLHADTFAIEDQSDIFSITHLGSDSFLVSNGDSCDGFSEALNPGFACRFLIGRNDGAGVTAQTGDQIVNLAEPGGNLVSDFIETHQWVGGPIYGEVVFASDTEGSVMTCASVGGCQGVETPGDQVVGSVFWSDGGSDTIVLHSDLVEPPPTVPEPSSLLLFAAGAGVIAGGVALRRKIRGSLQHSVSGS